MATFEPIVQATVAGFIAGVGLFYVFLGAHGVIDLRSSWKPFGRLLLEDLRYVWAVIWAISKRIGAAAIPVTRTLYNYAVALVAAVILLLALAVETVTPEPPTYTLRELQSMDYDEFEAIVGRLWERRGYRTTLTGPGPDFGVDVVAVNTNEKVAIEAKRYSKKSVSSPTIQKAHSAAQQAGADRAAVATSTGFSEPAERAATNLGVEMINGRQLTRELNGDR